MRPKKPSSEDLYREMQGPDPERAARAFTRFLVTPGELWGGLTPLKWAWREAASYSGYLGSLKWPVHKLDSTDWVGNRALLELAYKARDIEQPRAWVRRAIKNRIDWTLKDEKGPWGMEEESAIPDTAVDDPADTIWDDPDFCHQTALKINQLGPRLRPFAVYRLLDCMQPIEIAHKLKVSHELARQCCVRALDALVGRKHASRLLKMESAAEIREALRALPPDGKTPPAPRPNPDLNQESQVTPPGESADSTTRQGQPDDPEIHPTE